VLPAIMDISARAISLSDRPQWASWVTSARMRREDRSSILSHLRFSSAASNVTNVSHQYLIIAANLDNTGRLGTGARLL
jgi:hypothetical protein